MEAAADPGPDDGVVRGCSPTPDGSTLAGPVGIGAVADGPGEGAPSGRPTVGTSEVVAPNDDASTEVAASEEASTGGTSGTDVPGAAAAGAAARARPLAAPSIAAAAAAPGRAAR